MIGSNKSKVVTTWANKLLPWTNLNGSIDATQIRQELQKGNPNHFLSTITQKKKPLNVSNLSFIHENFVTKDQRKFLGFLT